ARAPVLEGHDVARLRCELAADLTAPRAELEGPSRPRSLLNGRNVFPGLVVASSVTTMERVEHAYLRLPRCVQDRQHIGDTVVGLRYTLEAVPHLTSLRDEVVVGVDHEKRRDLLVALHCIHVRPLVVRSSTRARDWARMQRSNVLDDGVG